MTERSLVQSIVSALLIFVGVMIFVPRIPQPLEYHQFADIQQIVSGAPEHLLAGGWLLLEHGFEQGPSVRQLLLDAGFTNAVTIRDLAGQERATRANRVVASG